MWYSPSKIHRAPEIRNVANTPQPQFCQPRFWFYILRAFSFVSCTHIKSWWHPHCSGIWNGFYGLQATIPLRVFVLYFVWFVFRRVSKVARSALLVSSCPSARLSACYQHIFHRTDFFEVWYCRLLGKPEAKRPLGRPRRRWEDNIRMDLQEVGVGYEDWIGLAQDRDRWRALVSAVRNLRLP